MTEDQKAAYINAQAAILNAKVAGMLAENQDRTVRDETPMYYLGDFEEEINTSFCTHNDCMALFHDLGRINTP